MQKIILGVVSVLVISAIAGGFYYLGQSKNEQISCTADAMICPDGTAVGRTGPKCEFATCPSANTSSDETASWEAYENRKYGYSFKYPKELQVQSQSLEFVQFAYFAPGSYTLELNNGAQLFITNVRNKTVTQASQDFQNEVKKYAGGMVSDFSGEQKTIIGDREAVAYTFVQKTFRYSKRFL